jgi:hypothetical protein
MQDWFTHNDIDYTDILMLGVAAMCGIPALILTGFGVYHTVVSGARLVASILV